MKPSNPVDAIPAGVRETAARWLALRETGMGPEEDLRFATWLEDDVHARAFAEAEEAFTALDAAGNLQPAIVLAPDPDLLKPDSGSAEIAPTRRWVRWSALASVAGLAAALVFGYVSWYQPRYGKYSAAASTGVGGLRQLELPDGSRVTMNTATSVKIDYSGAERRVSLAQGEALFQVAHQPDRPFIVSAQGVSIRAVGTAFNVRIGEARIEVLVTEGRVRVDSPSQLAVSPSAGTSAVVASRPVEIPAGHRLSVSLAPQLRSPPVELLSAPELDRTMAWRERRLEFYSTPLAEIVAQFNRYNLHQLVVEDPALAELRFGGKFKPDAPDDFVRLLENNFEVAAERSDGRTVLRAKH